MKEGMIEVMKDWMGATCGCGSFAPVARHLGCALLLLGVPLLLPSGSSISWLPHQLRIWEQLLITPLARFLQRFDLYLYHSVPIPSVQVIPLAPIYGFVPFSPLHLLILLIQFDSLKSLLMVRSASPCAHLTGFFFPFFYIYIFIQ